MLLSPRLRLRASIAIFTLFSLSTTANAQDSAFINPLGDPRGSTADGYEEWAIGSQQVVKWVTSFNGPYPVELVHSSSTETVAEVFSVPSTVFFGTQSFTWTVQAYNPSLYAESPLYHFAITRVTDDGITRILASRSFNMTSFSAEQESPSQTQTLPLATNSAEIIPTDAATGVQQPVIQTDNASASGVRSGLGTPSKLGLGLGLGLGLPLALALGVMLGLKAARRRRTDLERLGSVHEEVEMKGGAGGKGVDVSGREWSDKEVAGSGGGEGVGGWRVHELSSEGGKMGEMDGRGREERTGELDGRDAVRRELP